LFARCLAFFTFVRSFRNPVKNKKTPKRFFAHFLPDLPTTISHKKAWWISPPVWSPSRVDSIGLSLLLNVSSSTFQIWREKTHVLFVWLWKTSDSARWQQQQHEYVIIASPFFGGKGLFDSLGLFCVSFHFVGFFLILLLSFVLPCQGSSWTFLALPLCSLLRTSWFMSRFVLVLFCRSCFFSFALWSFNGVP
jgi:hypothetical protein